MIVFMITWLLGVVSLVQAAAVYPVRQVQSASPSSATCPMTVIRYVTITHTPPVVTIVVPNITEISRSLASASTIDSIVVVEQSQDAPVSNHPDTSIPTFIQTIVASAFEATEISGSGSTAVYVSDSHTLSRGVIVGTTTISVLPKAVTTSTSSTAVSSTIRVTTTQRASTPGSSDGMQSGSTDAFPVSDSSSAAGTISASDSFGTTTTATTYVATVTEEITVAMAPVAAFGNAYASMFPSLLKWPTGSGGIDKRQTCVLVSADVGNHQTATWCNNWDGSTTMSYTSWETTITPGQTPGTTSTLSSRVSTPPVVVSTVSTESTSDVGVSSSSTMLSQTISPVQPSSTGSIPTSASPAATSCGQTGAFDINFDDLPEQSVFPNETAGSPPIFNPFDHFYWEAGWTYGPPPAQPYAPHNGDQLAIYNTTLNNDMPSSPNAAGVVRGGFSAGPRSSFDQYWFNAKSAWFGCQNNLTSPSGVCDFVAEGYEWNNDTQAEQLVITQHFKQALCERETCDLQFIEFSAQFTGLCTLAFYANINGQLRDFYIDDLSMGWWNNTCDAGLMRISSRK